MNKWASEKPNELAFADENNALTFAQLDSLSRRTATMLKEKGIQQGELVSLNLPTYLEWTTSLALHLLGAIPMQKIGTKAYPDTVFPDWLISLNLSSNISASKTLIFDEDFLEAVKKKNELLDVPGYVSSESTARLFSTSGTTGDSKYIAMTADDLADLSMRVGSTELAGNNPVLSLFPLGMGASYRLALRNLQLGTTLFRCGFSDYRLPKLLRMYPIKTLLGSPIQISAFLTAQKQTGTELPNLKTIILAGSGVSQELVNRIKTQLGCRIFNDYGSAEAGFVALKEITDNIEVGFSINQSVALQIVDENDVEVTSPSIGQIRYKKTGMARSYLNNAVASAEVFKDDYFYPGDHGFLDESGLLHLTGRVNEVVNLSGVKMNLDKVDSVAMSQLGVVDCASFSVISEAGIEELAVAYVSNNDFNLDRFAKALEKKLSLKPKYLISTYAIPRNNNGKILRQELQKEFKEREKLSE